MEHAAVAAGHIAFERRGALGLVTLTRPDALNALTHDMVLAMTARLNGWAADDRVAAVAIRGEGRAFSAGGDIRVIHDRGRAGEPFDRFFADEYALNILIESYPKPYVALVNGVAMGGGVGVAYHASHVVVGERARFAMPECGIGFFPDVGGTALLSALGLAGRYLGLTGARLNAAQQIALGLADAHASLERQGSLLDALASGASVDEATERAVTTSGGEAVADDHVFAAFGREDPSAIVAYLGASDVADPMRGKSPTSLHVASRQLALGSGLTFGQCMGIEARIAHRMLRGHDFYEGIRAAIIDKGATPAWSPASLDAVSRADVDAYFAPVEDGPLAAISALADGVDPRG